MGNIMHEQTQNITILLGQLTGGNKQVIDQLLPMVYQNLQALARKQLRLERANHTLNTSALVHEAYLKLVDQKQVSWQNRAHFFAIASQAMRRILINYAEKRMADKRNAGRPLATFDENAYMRESRAEELIRLDLVLTELAERSQRQARIVEYSFFGGLTHEEIAEVLGISAPTVRRDWRMARAWLSREMRSG